MIQVSDIEKFVIHFYIGGCEIKTKKPFSIDARILPPFKIAIAAGAHLFLL